MNPALLALLLFVPVPPTRLEAKMTSRKRKIVKSIKDLYPLIKIRSELINNIVDAGQGKRVL